MLAGGFVNIIGDNKQKSIKNDSLIKNELTFYASPNTIWLIVITINHYFLEEIFQMASVFAAGVAALMVPVITGLVYLSGFFIVPEGLTRDMHEDCVDTCSQVAVLNGIDSAKALCGGYGAPNPFSLSYSYQKCVKPAKFVEELTGEATKIIDNATAEFEARLSNPEQQQSSREIHVVNGMIHSRAKEHGLDLTTICSLSEDRYISDKLLYCGRNLEHALLDVARVVRKGSNHWRNQRSCEWLTSLPYAEPFCEANKDVQGCKEFLDIYGNCEKILADAANKNEL